jgi:hypothetical protein
MRVTLDNGETDRTSSTITVENEEPNAVIDYSPNNPTPEDKITFSASGSSDPDGEISEYVWNINGEEYTMQDVSTTLSPSGKYTVELAVKDAAGATDTTSETVVVQWNDDVSDTESDESSGDTPGVDDDGESDTPGAGDSVINPEFEIIKSSPTTEIFTIKSGESASFIADVDSYRLPNAKVKLFVDEELVSESDLEAETIQRSHTFDSIGSQTVRMVVDDGEGQRKFVTWEVVVHDFNAKPLFAEQSSAQTIAVSGNTDLVTFSVENPSVNSKDIIAGISAQPPDGISISGTSGSQGSAAIQTSSGVVSPGSVQSMRLRISVDDESLAGESITIPYQTRYHPAGNDDQVYIDSRTELTIDIEDTSADTQPDQPDESPSEIPQSWVYGGVGLIIVLILIKI